MRCLNRDNIKYFAIFAMVLNHIATIFMEKGTWQTELLLGIGYFTAITMCYFLVEGYQYTHSKRNYGRRLLLFAVISQIPYCLAFTEQDVIQFQSFNMLFALFLCFLLNEISERVISPAVRATLIFIIFVVSLFCDWSFLAPVFTLLFIRARGDRQKMKEAYLISIVLFAAFNFVLLIAEETLVRSLILVGLSLIGPVLSAICILYLYNGERSSRGRNFSKWFFYVFYPAHLLVLGILRIA